MANQTQLLSSQGIRGDSSFTTTGVRQGLDTIAVDIEDTAHLSNYFQVVEFNPVFTAGKNSISFNGSNLLANNSEIKVEVLDAAGNSLYLASPPASAGFVDIANFTVAIYVFQEVVNGPGNIYLVGTTAQGEIVRWTGNISINNTYKNVSRTRFVHTPEIEIEPLLIPTVDITTAASIGIATTATGSCRGYSVALRNHPPPPQIISNGNNADYRVIITSFSSTMGGNGFNPDMIGAKIILFVEQAQDPTFKGNPPKMDTINSTQSFTIKNVISSNELQLDGNVIDSTVTMVTTWGPWNGVQGLVPISSINNRSNYVSPSFNGNFLINYTQTSKLNLYQNIPVIGTLNLYGSSTQLITNQPFFTASMVGNAIQVNYNTLDLGHTGASYTISPAVSSSINRNPISSSNFTVLNITNSYTGSISPIYYTLFNSTNPHVIDTTTYIASLLYGTVTALTSSVPYQSYTSIISSSTYLEKSYADIIFRNLDTFSGFVARQKLYAKSNTYPGDFELISDTPLSPTELLYDPLTINKSYSDIGIFYDQNQVNTYWFASSSSLNLVQTDVPLMSGMTITTVPDYTSADGNSYVIAKVTAINSNNDSKYYPFDQTSYLNVQGAGYTSNFIFLEQGVLYSLSVNAVVNKNPSVPASVAFYLTSSVPSISNEPNFTPRYGLLLGEIDISDAVGTKTFGEAQEFLFTPMNDYYGTLVIVPFQCNVTLANLSLQNYGDYGFSPGGTVIQVPFPVNSANESWTLKAELYDNNSNLVFTTTPVVQTFDPYGLSLFGSSILASTGTGSAGGFPTTVPQLTIVNNLYTPGLQLFDPPGHFVSWQQNGGALGYTHLTNIKLLPTNTGSSTLDYINVEMDGGATWARALAVRYSGSASTVYGRRIYVDATGSKFTYL